MEKETACFQRTVYWCWDRKTGKMYIKKSRLVSGISFVSRKGLCYFTESTMALNVSGLFIARSAKTLRLRPRFFFPANPIN